MNNSINSNNGGANGGSVKDLLNKFQNMAQNTTQQGPNLPPASRPAGGNVHARATAFNGAQQGGSPLTERSPTSSAPGTPITPGKLTAAQKGSISGLNFGTPEQQKKALEEAKKQRENEKNALKEKAEREQQAADQGKKGGTQPTVKNSEKEIAVEVAPGAVPPPPSIAGLANFRPVRSGIGNASLEKAQGPSEKKDLKKTVLTSEEQAKRKSFSDVKSELSQILAQKRIESEKLGTKDSAFITPTGAKATLVPEKLGSQQPRPLPVAPRAKLATQETGSIPAMSSDEVEGQRKALEQFERQKQEKQAQEATRKAQSEQKTAVSPASRQPIQVAQSTVNYPALNQLMGQPVSASPSLPERFGNQFTAAERKQVVGPTVVAPVVQAQANNTYYLAALFVMMLGMVAAYMFVNSQRN